jgi:hypothetical protein
LPWTRCRDLSAAASTRKEPAVKLLIEILLAIILHPIAVVLVWINLAGRSDLTGLQKLIWAIVAIVWGIGPILYVLVGGGELW